MTLSPQQDEQILQLEERVLILEQKDQKRRLGMSDFSHLQALLKAYDERLPKQLLQTSLNLIAKFEEPKRPWRRILQQWFAKFRYANCAYVTPIGFYP